MALIQQEQAKIAVLRAKIEECERRVELLQSFVNADELDVLLTRNVLAPGETLGKSETVPMPKLRPLLPPLPAHLDAALQTFGNNLSDPSSSVEYPKRALTSDALAILRFIGERDRTLDELEEFCRSQGMEQNRGALRSMMSSYKKKHGFIESAQSGVFQLTKRAVEFLDEHYPEVQSETPPVGAEGVSVGVTKTAVEAEPIQTD